MSCISNLALISFKKTYTINMFGYVYNIFKLMTLNIKNLAHSFCEPHNLKLILLILSNHTGFRDVQITYFVKIYIYQKQVL